MSFHNLKHTTGHIEVNEAILQPNNYVAGSGGKIIFHKMGDKIYGYKPKDKDLWKLKEDGTYSYANSQMTEDLLPVSLAFQKMDILLTNIRMKQDSILCDIKG